MELLASREQDISAEFAATPQIEVGKLVATVRHVGSRNTKNPWKTETLNTHFVLDRWLLNEVHIYVIILQNSTIYHLFCMSYLYNIWYALLVIIAVSRSYVLEAG